MSEWRDVVGWVGLYQVSDHGEVRSGACVMTPLTPRERRMLEALRKLRNEVHGVLALASPEIEAVASLTNLRCLELRMREAADLIMEVSEAERAQGEGEES